MENILERAIIPRNPSPMALLNKEKYTLYAPVARSGQPGIAQFDDAHFVITDQIVQINTNIIATVSHVAMVHNGLVERINTKIQQEQIRSDAYAEAKRDEAKAYADEKVQQEQIRSDQYAEAKRDEAKAYADEKVRQEQIRSDEYAEAKRDEAKAYADGQIQQEQVRSDQYADEMHNLGKAYADGQAAQALTDAKSYTDALVSAGWTREIVTELPTPENAKFNVVYMVRRNTGLKAQDIYDEYFLVNINGVLSLELFGNTELDLSQYAPLVDGKVPVENTPTAAFDIIRGSFSSSGIDFYPDGEHQEELTDWGSVVPRRGVLYCDMSTPNSENPIEGAICIWRGNGFERIATVADLQSLVQSIYREIEDVEQDVDALEGQIGDISSALDELHAYAQNLVNGGSAE